MKKQVLWMSDFNCSSGFSRVAENIVQQLEGAGEYEIDVVASNYFGDPHKWGLKVYPALKPAYYENWTGIERVIHMLLSGKYDILFILQDAFHLLGHAYQLKAIQKELKKRGLKTFKWIYYFPVDGWQPKEWVTEVVKHADYPVTYTQFAKKEIDKADPLVNPSVIYHGINTKEFFPVNDEEKKKFRHLYFHGQADGKYLVTNVNKNWLRKDIPRTLSIFSKFKKKYPNSYLYLHMKTNDAFCDITQVASQFGLEFGKDYAMPTDIHGNPAGFNENQGVPTEVLNLIYNVSDVVISTSMGEGWGLSSIESMATRTPIIMPKNTSFLEICADNRCPLVSCGEGNNWICMGRDDWNRTRPLVDENAFFNQLEFTYNNKEFAKERAEKAYKWVTTELNWDKIGEQWKEIFKKASKEDVKVPKVGRNDDCPECKKENISIKWKKCKKHNN